MQLESKHDVEQRAKLNASVFKVVQGIGESATIEEACERIAKFIRAQNATLLAVKFSDWADKQPAIRPYSNYPDSIKAVVEQLKNFDGCPMTQESRARLAPYSYRSIDRNKYKSLLERRFLQETDKLGYRDIAVLPVIAGQGILVATVGLDRIFDERLRAYSSGVIQHITAAFLANFPQVAKLFDGKLLSSLEAGVLTAYCKGMAEESISEKFGVSTYTIRQIWKSAETKLEAGNRYEAIYRAMVIGELDLPRSVET